MNLATIAYYTYQVAIVVAIPVTGIIAFNLGKYWSVGQVYQGFTQHIIK